MNFHIVKNKVILIIKKTPVILLFVYGSIGISKVIILLTNIYLANILGVNEYGNYIIVYSFMQIMVIFPILGFNRGMLKYIPFFNITSQTDYNKNIIQFSILATTIIGIVISLILFYQYDNIALYILVGLEKGMLIKYMSFYALVYPLMIIILVIFQANNKIKEYALGLFIVEPLLLFLTIIIMKNIILTDAILPIFSRYISSAITMVIFFILAIKMKLLKFTKHIYPKVIKEYFSYSLPLLFVSTLGLLIVKTNILISSIYLSSKDIAILSAASQYGIISSMFLMAINQSYTHKISELYSSNDYIKLAKLYRIIVGSLFLLSTLVLVIVVIFRDFLMGLYGVEYLVGTTVLIIIMLGQTFNTFTGVSATFINILGDSKDNLYINIFVLVYNIIFGFWIIQKFGIIGSAVVFSTSLFFSNIIRLIIVYIKYRFLFGGVYNETEK